ncbi:MAG TPA: L,D-transpeptidase [Trebonia sp.]|nr:L,D-transpeptidase [Trebonia sp.]
MSHRARTGPVAWLAVPATVVLAAAAWLAVSASTRAADAPARGADALQARAADVPPSAPAATSAPARSLAATSPSPKLPGPGAKGIALSPRERARCASTASACADLTAHLTWLQADGRITYGPVRMEPGGASEPTPRGVFHVAWKAGPHYISTSYGVPIPYAVFFAAGGVAFHEGSLSTSSHGCIHLTMGAARYYNQHLPVGAEVEVF